MNNRNEPEQALEEIKQIMNRSSRFVSLSGWSGVAAGICALAACWLANNKLKEYNGNDYLVNPNNAGNGFSLQPDHYLLVLGLITFLAALLFAFLFTYLRSRKTGIPIWSFTARKVMINVAVPMIAGAFLIWRILDFKLYALIAPACLLFYGLALINGSKYTLYEVRYLGYLQLTLGIINLVAIGYGLYFCAAGFGILHILYGIVMWNKYERTEKTGA